MHVQGLRAGAVDGRGLWLRGWGGGGSGGGRRRRGPWKGPKGLESNCSDTDKTRKRCKKNGVYAFKAFGERSV